MPDLPLTASERERLDAAERALVVYGWCAAGLEDREAAALELWRRWSVLVPEGFLGPAAHPDIDIRALVACRTARRDQVEARLRDWGKRGR